jgi:hypothetical protein
MVQGNSLSHVNVPQGPIGRGEFVNGDATDRSGSRERTSRRDNSGEAEQQMLKWRGRQQQNTDAAPYRSGN